MAPKSIGLTVLGRRKGNQVLPDADVEAAAQRGAGGGAGSKSYISDIAASGKALLRRGSKKDPEKEAMQQENLSNRKSLRRMQSFLRHGGLHRKQAVPQSRMAMLTWVALHASRLVVVACLTLLMAHYFISVPYQQRYTYLHQTADRSQSSGNTSDDQSFADLGYAYNLIHDDTAEGVSLFVTDIVDTNKQADEEYIRSYSSLVLFPRDRSNKYGWNLADILDIPRVVDPSLTFSDKLVGRMVQNYAVCSSNCLDSNSGLPNDFYNSTFNNQLHLKARTRNYGTAWGDSYLQRGFVMSYLDPEFYRAFFAPRFAGISEYYGNFGLPTPVDLSPLDLLMSTTPTEKGYICGLGPPRLRHEGILLQVKSCHVQIAATAGSTYQVFLRQRTRLKATVELNMRVITNTTTGCSYLRNEVVVESKSCPRGPSPGGMSQCQDNCGLVLMKGAKARPMKVAVQETGDASEDPSILFINDEDLVLRRRTEDPDLAVEGNAMEVYISRASLGLLDIELKSGKVHLEKVRLDKAKVVSSQDDLLIEDTRPTMLRYRSPKDLVCLAAPTVEAVPDIFTSCHKNILSQELRKQPLSSFYDSTHDGYVDRDEFLDGLASIGILDELGKPTLKLLLSTLFRETTSTLEDMQMGMHDMDHRLHAIAPFFTTMYDIIPEIQCLESCSKNNLASANSSCVEECSFTCTGGDGITEATYGLCMPSKICEPGCGHSDGSKSGKNTLLSASLLDTTQDGLVTAEELRQVLLLAFSNCTYYIQDPENSSSRCSLSITKEEERITLTPSCGEYTGLLNAADWRINNPGIPDASDEAKAMYGGVPYRECRPFPDYDPSLRGLEYSEGDTESSCPSCFFNDGTRVPASYYNRSTWTTENYNAIMRGVRAAMEEYAANVDQFPYFNISDDKQWNEFAGALFSEFSSVNSLAADVFDRNMDALKSVPGLQSIAYIFDPHCYKLIFMKIEPDFSNSSVSYDDAMLVQGMGGYVSDTKMPGYWKDSSTDGRITPCPPEWGTGRQGSTSFTYFDWANSSTGYKWGKALPMSCLDEAWPLGGINGSYPNDSEVYGIWAGERIPPGCQPAACSAVYTAELLAGSIHAQVLPFAYDALNETGMYQNMLSSCTNSDGKRSCFKKGYPDDMDGQLSLTSSAALANLHRSTASSVFDTFLTIEPYGVGTPPFKKWFYTSRSIYMDLEPPLLSVLSFGLFTPKLNRLPLHMSPGYCDPEFGAVEHLDWRYAGQLTPLAQPTSIEREQDYRGTSIMALQIKRETKTLKAINAVLANKSSDNTVSGALYLRQVWRKEWTNESLFLSTSTMDGITDTGAGVSSTSGTLAVSSTVGKYWRHHRVCLPDLDSTCEHQFLLYRDNCRIRRVAVWNQSSGQYTLTPCHFANGLSAFLDPILKEGGVTFNESAYLDQFPHNDRTFNTRKTFGPAEVLDYNYNTTDVHRYRLNSITSYFTTRHSASLRSDGAVVFTPLHTGLRPVEVVVMATLIISIVTAGFAGILILWFGGYIAWVRLRYLKEKRNAQEAEWIARFKEVKFEIIKDLPCKLKQSIMHNQFEFGFNTDELLSLGVGASQVPAGVVNPVAAPKSQQTGPHRKQQVLSKPAVPKPAGATGPSTPGWNEEEVSIVKYGRLLQESPENRNLTDWRIQLKKDTVAALWGRYWLSRPLLEKDAKKKEQAKTMFLKACETVSIDVLEFDEVVTRWRNDTNAFLDRDREWLRSVEQLLHHGTGLMDAKSRMIKGGNPETGPAKKGGKQGAEGPGFYLPVLARLYSLLVLIWDISTKILFPKLDSPFVLLDNMVRNYVLVRVLDPFSAFVRSRCIRNHKLDPEEVYFLGGKMPEDLQSLYRLRRKQYVLGRHDDAPVYAVMSSSARKWMYRVDWVCIDMYNAPDIEPAEDEESRLLCQQDGQMPCAAPAASTSALEGATLLIREGLRHAEKAAPMMHHRPWQWGLMCKVPRREPEARSLMDTAHQKVAAIQDSCLGWLLSWWSSHTGPNPYKGLEDMSVTEPEGPVDFWHKNRDHGSPQAGQRLATRKSQASGDLGSAEEAAEEVQFREIRLSAVKDQSFMVHYLLYTPQDRAHTTVLSVGFVNQRPTIRFRMNLKSMMLALSGFCREVSFPANQAAASDKVLSKLKIRKEKVVIQYVKGLKPRKRAIGQHSGHQLVEEGLFQTQLREPPLPFDQDQNGILDETGQAAGTDDVEELPVDLMLPSAYAGMKATAHAPEDNEIDISSRIEFMPMHLAELQGVPDFQEDVSGQQPQVRSPVQLAAGDLGSGGAAAYSQSDASASDSGSQAEGLLQAARREAEAVNAERPVLQSPAAGPGPVAEGVGGKHAEEVGGSFRGTAMPGDQVTSHPSGPGIGVGYKGGARSATAEEEEDEEEEEEEEEAEADEMEEEAGLMEVNEDAKLRDRRQRWHRKLLQGMFRRLEEDSAHNYLAFLLLKYYYPTGQKAVDMVRVDDMHAQFMMHFEQFKLRQPCGQEAVDAAAGGVLASADADNAKPTAQGPPRLTKAQKRLRKKAHLWLNEQVQPSAIQSYGFKWEERPHYNLEGVAILHFDNKMVNVLMGSVENGLIYAVLHVAKVGLHLASVWILALPFIFAVLFFQGQLEAVTAVQPVLTWGSFRDDFNQLTEGQISPVFQALLWIALGWLCLGYLLICAHYIMDLLSLLWRKAWPVRLLRRIFSFHWVALALMAGTLVSYVCLVMCWLILGAVISPDAYLPYCTAVITSVAYGGNLWSGLANERNGKLQAIRTKATQKLVSRVMSAVESAKAGALEGANSALRSVADAVPAKAMQSAKNALERLDLDGRGAVAANAAASQGQNGNQGGTWVDSVAKQIENQTQQLATGVFARVKQASVHFDRRQSTLPPGVVDSTLAPVMSLEPAQSLGMNGGPSRAQQQGVSAVPSAGQQAALAGTAAKMSSQAFLAYSAATDLKEGLNQAYYLFQKFSGADKKMAYDEFCELLAQFDINLPESRRRKLFAAFDKDASGFLTWDEFEKAFKLLIEDMVIAKMKQMGLTWGPVILTFIMFMLLLLLIFAFIFVGVAAFTGSGTIGSVINSLLTAGSGVALSISGGSKSAQKQGEQDEEEEEEEAVDVEEAASGDQMV